MASDLAVAWDSILHFSEERLPVAYRAAGHGDRGRGLLGTGHAVATPRAPAHRTVARPGSVSITWTRTWVCAPRSGGGCHPFSSTCQAGAGLKICIVTAGQQPAGAEETEDGLAARQSGKTTARVFPGARSESVPRGLGKAFGHSSGSSLRTALKAKTETGIVVWNRSHQTFPSREDQRGPVSRRGKRAGGAGQSCRRPGASGLLSRRGMCVYTASSSPREQGLPGDVRAEAPCDTPR